MLKNKRQVHHYVDQQLRCKRCGWTGKHIGTHRDSRNETSTVDTIGPSGVMLSIVWCYGPYTIEDIVGGKLVP